MEKQFQYNNGQVFYQVTGTGQPVVLLHGFAEDGTIWEEQISFLRQHVLLIVPDLPGSGKSDMLSRETVTIDDYADFVDALLTFERIDKCILLGHSMGGYITLAFAEKYPGKLAAFGFIHSTAFADSDEKKNTRKKGIKLIKEYGVYSFLKNTTPNLFSDHYKKEHPEKVTELIERGRNFSQEALVQYYAAMMNRPDRTDVLRKTNVPVLFIIGTEDIAAPLEDLLKQVSLPKVSSVHIINNAGHMSMWEQPTQLNSHLLAFIENFS